MKNVSNDNIERARRNYYNNADSGKVFLLVILFQLVVSLILSLIVSQIASSYEIDRTVITSSVWYIAGTTLANVLVYFFVYFFYTRKRIELSAVKVKFNMKWHTYLMVIAVGVITLLGVQYLISSVDDVLFIIGYKLSVSPINPTDFGSFMLATLLLAVAPAIFEELIFRGIVFQGLNKRFKTIYAMLLSSLLFALFHGNIQQLVYPFILGMVMSWIVYRTGSIVSSMIVHFINNFLVVLTGFSMGLPGVWWKYLLAVGLAVITAGIFFLLDKFYFKKLKQEEKIEKEKNTSIFLYIAFGVVTVLFILGTILGFYIQQ